MKAKRVILPITACPLILAMVAVVSTSRAGYETASYKVIKKEGKFEIRAYASHRVVTTSMRGSGQNGSFGRLFQYISGNNGSEQKIAMTTPVFMPADSKGNTREMQFVIPAKVAASGAPAPSSGNVKIKSMGGGKFAVLRFNGRSGGSEQKEKLKKLRAEIESRGLKVKGDPIFAGYDPPWTPGPMRRNEVLLRIE
jgi:effector-binding domain-containing protein